MTEFNQAAFKSAGDALRFAFNHSSQAYDRPLMNRMASGIAPSFNDALVGLNGAGTAGMIFHALKSLNGLQQAIIVADFVPKRVHCACGKPCCSGMKEPEIWAQAVLYIANQARSQALSGRVTNPRLVEQLVRRVFGDKYFTFEELAAKYGVSDKTTREHHSKIRMWLNGNDHYDALKHIKGVRISTYDTVDRLLRADGIVGEIE